MTGQQIYEIASSFLYEKDGEDQDSRDFSPGFLNILLQEALDCENSIRLAAGGPELERAPWLDDLSQDVPYHDSITRIALPYGLASWFFQEASKTFQAENYRNKFIAALEDARKHRFVPIIDVYGGDGDA